MIRRSERVPGYDCRMGYCPHEPKCDPSKGGRHGEEWHYVIAADDGLSAVTLRVFTHIAPHPALPYHEPPPKGVSPAELAYHAAYVHEDPLGRLEHPIRDCEYVAGGRCLPLDDSTLPARELWDRHGDARGFEQSESFWRALEDKFVERDVQHRADLVTPEAVEARAVDEARRDAWLAFMESAPRKTIVIAGDVTEFDLYRWLKAAMRRQV